jgi:hypothetical protein
MTDTFTTLLDDATAGLKDDPELRLDVRVELASHLEATAAVYEAEGHQEAESRDLAAQDFGSPAEVAGELLAANKQRMTVRALVRLFLRAVVVPAAVIVAVLVGYGSLARVVNLARQAQRLFFVASLPKLPHLPQVVDTRTAAERRALAVFEESTGYTGFESERRQQQRYAQWQARRNTPDAARYYAYYTILRPIEKGPNYWRENYHNYNPHSEPPPAEELAVHHRNFTAFAGAMCTGMNLELGNALYDYWLARGYLNQSMMANDSMAEMNATSLPDELYDREDFDKGVAALARGLEKPYLTAYHMEMVQSRVARLPQTRTTEHCLAAVADSYSELMPEFSQLRELCREYGGCVNILIRQGRKAEAERLLAHWDGMSRQITRRAGCLIEVLVAQALVPITGSHAAAAYRSLGEPAKARAVEAVVARATAQHAQWRALDQRMRQYESDRRNRRLLAEANGLPAPPVLSAPARRYEVTMAEQLGFGALMLLLTLGLLAAAGVYAYWAIRLRGARTAPLLLVPTGADAARVLGGGVLLPVLAWLLYTSLPLGGRAYGFSYLWVRLLVEFGVLAVLLVGLPAVLTVPLVRARCRRLGIELPPERRFVFPWRTVLIIIAAVAALYGIVCLAQSEALYYWREPWATLMIVVLIGAWIAGIVLLLRRLGWQWRLANTPAPAALYRGTVAYALLPAYAAAVLLLALTVRPYLDAREQRCLRDDRLVFPSMQTGVPPYETEMTQRLKRELQAILEDTP